MAGLWASTFGDGNSFEQSVSNTFEGTNYEKGVNLNEGPGFAITGSNDFNDSQASVDRLANAWSTDDSGGGDNDNGGGGSDNSTAVVAPEAEVVPEVPYDPQTILDYATAAGMVESDAQIAELLADPAKWLSDRSINLTDVVPTLTGNEVGTNLNPNDPAYALAGDVAVTPSIADVTNAGSVDQGVVTGYTADTSADKLGTDATTVNAATGTLSDDAQVKAEQIDMTGAATGVNADGTISVTGEALNKFATQNISTMIDTSTVAGKLLAQQLGEGNYTDSKATVLGQMKIISAEFKDSNGQPRIPPWAQALARETNKSMAFGGITGTAQTAAMANALMEATLGVAEKDATFFQTITTKNLDNRQEAIINKANVLAKFEVANLDARQASVVHNAQAFLDMDLKNLTNEQQAEVVNTQAMVDAIFDDVAATNASRLFTADAENDFTKYYDNMNAIIDMHRAEQTNSMRKFNTGEINDAAEYNATMEDSRQRFYANMQYNLDVSNAKWRQEVATTNNENKFEAASDDVQNALDISTEAMNQMWDRVDNLLDYVFKGADSEANRDAMILQAQISAQASGGSSSGKYTAGGAIISSAMPAIIAW